jgi:uncharacterized protein involved in cysteine biosynthesis
MRPIARPTAAIARSPDAWPSAVRPILALVGAWVIFAALGFWVVAKLSVVAIGGDHPVAAVVRAIFDIVFGVAAIVVALLLALAVAQPFARSSLARLVATLAPNAPKKEPASSLSRALVVATVGAAGSLTAVGLLEAITTVVPEGLVITEPLALLAGALAVTWDLFDYPLSRHGLTLRQRVAWLWANKWTVLGFTAATQVLVLVPGLVLPVGVVAASRLVGTIDRLEPDETPKLFPGDDDPTDP